MSDVKHAAVTHCCYCADCNYDNDHTVRCPQCGSEPVTASEFRVEQRGWLSVSESLKLLGGNESGDDR